MTLTSNTNNFNTYGQKPNNSRAYVINAPKILCNYCKQGHYIYNCDNFLQLEVNKRITEIKRRHLCLNCLKGNHNNKSCTLRGCNICHRKHNTLLHINTNNAEKLESSIASDKLIELNTNYAIAGTSGSELSPDASFVSSNQVSLNKGLMQNNTQIQKCLKNTDILSQTLLSTACIQILDAVGNSHVCRALLDPGSQVNFITTKLCDKLQLPKLKCNLNIAGVSNCQSNVSFKTNFSFKSQTTNFITNISSLVLDQITPNLPNQYFELKALQIPAHIRLADPKPNITGEVDVLLGASIFWDLLCVGQHKLGKNKPILQKTKLGWVLGGSLQIKNKESSDSACLSVLQRANIQKQLEAFWELEECTNSNPKFSNDEQYCEDNFVKTTFRDSNGRFKVNLPLKNNVSELGESRTNALKRFYSLERKLGRDPILKNEYVRFLEEYEKLGHMTKITNPHNLKGLIHYLPHHAITKSSSSTTKTRVVFDASAKTSSNLSFNDVQYAGPVIQDSLFSILLRFRKHTYVITADIEKMYRQVWVEESQRNLQLILWRSDPGLPIAEYQLNTITYGTASASFMAIRCLKQIALDFKKKFPIAARVIQTDFYVDDLVTGCDSKAEIIQLKSHITKILSTAGFYLRKWACNHDDIIENRSLSAQDDKIHMFNNNNPRTLGLLWNPQEDALQYEIRENPNKKTITKRHILSVTGKIFDPLGLLGPIIILSKLILQNLWQLNLNWDESVPMSLHTKWIKLQDQMPHIRSIKIPRHVICNNSVLIELHGFCNASESAYGACVYIKSINESGTVAVNLLCAKSRVAPLKTITLPRLELCGALILARLVNNVKSSLKLEFSKTFLWCDSTIALSWIQSDSSKWKTFIANRVSEIRNLTNIDSWKHVSTNDNPADLLSRGILPNKLKNCDLWWYGPHWMKNDVTEWPLQHKLDKTNLEARIISCIANIQIPCSKDFSKFSSLQRLLRVVGYCYRFINNAKTKQEHRISGSLSINETKEALRCLIKISQQESLYKDIRHLIENNYVESKSSLLGLNPFLDQQGLLRVGGRIRHSNQNFDKKHPVILPTGHWLTKLICYNEHIRLLHCGANQLLASLRDKYWPISAKGTIRKIIHECIPCFRAKPKSLNPIMGDLPKERVLNAPPFYNCGVDYAGPVMIKSRKGRGGTLIKSYICIFVCCSTKAIHLELVTDLSTTTFLAALKRFIARRGQPLNIYSDNGSTFIGAKSELKEFKAFQLNPTTQNEIVNYLKENNTRWHFIPPRSPHFGGYWEAGVKSIKNHLKRVAANTHLTYEEYYTLLTQIEAVLNSRPLTPVSTDPQDINPLTPAHFLIGRKLTAIPEENLQNVPDNRLTKYEHIKKLTQHFWQRWSKEYLHHLQVRLTWKTHHHDIVKLGALALIKEDNTPPFKWLLGRIS